MAMSLGEKVCRNLPWQNCPNESYRLKSKLRLVDP